MNTCMTSNQTKESTTLDLVLITYTREKLLHLTISRDLRNKDQGSLIQGVSRIKEPDSANRMDIPCRLQSPPLFWIHHNSEHLKYPYQWQLQMNGHSPSLLHLQPCTQQKLYNKHLIEDIHLLSFLLMFLLHFFNNRRRNVNSFDGSLIMKCQVFTQIGITTSNYKDLNVKEQ